MGISRAQGTSTNKAGSVWISNPAFQPSAGTSESLPRGCLLGSLLIPSPCVGFLPSLSSAPTLPCAFRNRLQTMPSAKSLSCGPQIGCFT